MFTTPCFIRKNTPELRQRLEKLGYVDNSLYRENETNLYVGGYIYTSADFIDPYYYDCGTNEELFLALAALRDDKPDYQWFLWEDNDGIYHTELEDSWRKYIPNEKWEEWWWFEVRKATVEELIEHFNGKQYGN